MCWTFRRLGAMLIGCPCDIIDDEHPAPGLLVPSRSVTEHRRRSIRFLAGAHDVDAFVPDLWRADSGEVEVVRCLYRSDAQVWARAKAERNYERSV